MSGCLQRCFICLTCCHWKIFCLLHSCCTLLHEQSIHSSPESEPVLFSAVSYVYLGWLMALRWVCGFLWMRRSWFSPSPVQPKYPWYWAPYCLWVCMIRWDVYEWLKLLVKAERPCKVACVTSVLMGECDLWHCLSVKHFDWSWRLGKCYTWIGPFTTYNFETSEVIALIGL